MKRDVINLADMQFPIRCQHNSQDIAVWLQYILADVLPIWQHRGVIGPSESFGVVIANPMYAGHFHDLWRNPYELAGLVMGSGVGVRQELVNALRQMRVSARTSIDSADLESGGDRENCFVDRVDPLYDTPAFLPWGDLVRGGAVLYGQSDKQWLVSVSGFAPLQNHAIALTTASMLSAIMAAYA